MTTTGYAIRCPQCGNNDALSIPEVESVPGDDTTIVRYVHHIDCPTCDQPDTLRRPAIEPPAGGYHQRDYHG